MKDKIMQYQTLPLSGFLLLTQLNITAQVPIDPGKPPPPPKVLDVKSYSTASGWMGDGTNGTKFVQLNLANTENPRQQRTNCIMVKYTQGPLRWAGMYWLNKPDNWGDKPGDDLSTARYAKITFWVRGETGTEKVEFKGGSVEDGKKPYKDSFAVTTGMIDLTKQWQRKEMSLQGQNLSSVIGLFCWVATCDANPAGVTFYLDDIRYE